MEGDLHSRSEPCLTTMAVISTSSTLLAEVSNFSAPATLGGEPFSVAEWIGTLVVPAKDAANQSLATITLTFPESFVFKIATLHIHYTAAVGPDIFDLVKQVTPGIIGQGFKQTNQNLVISSQRIQLDGAGTNFRVTGEDNMIMSQPVGNYQVPIRTGNFAGDNSMSWQWADLSSDASVAITIVFRMRAMMYTIEQFNQFGMFAAVPVIGV